MANISSGLKNGLVSAIPAIAGSMFFNPLISAPIAGYAAESFMDMDGAFEMGIGIGIASIFIGSTTRSSGRRTM